MRIQDWLWKVLGPRPQIPNPGPVIDVNEELQYLNGALIRLTDRLVQLENEIDKLKQRTYTIDGKLEQPGKTYKFKPTVRSTTGLIQILENRSFEAANLKHENPDPKEIA